MKRKKRGNEEKIYKNEIPQDECTWHSTSLGQAFQSISISLLLVQNVGTVHSVFTLTFDGKRILLINIKFNVG